MKITRKTIKNNWHEMWKDPLFFWSLLAIGLIGFGGLLLYFTVAAIYNFIAHNIWVVVIPILLFCIVFVFLFGFGGRGQDEDEDIIKVEIVRRD